LLLSIPTSLRDAKRQAARCLAKPSLPLHPSLASGTKVKVTNTKNNKTVEVRINDRGPTQAGRAIDLSSAAATKIGIGKKQMMPVKLEVTDEAPAKKGGK
jgi:rare lipoprotein A